MWRLNLSVQQQVLLGGHVVKEDVVLHAHSQLFSDVINVGLHVSAIHLNGARSWSKEPGEEGPKIPQSLVFSYYLRLVIRKSFHVNQIKSQPVLQLPVCIFATWEIKS